MQTFLTIKVLGVISAVVGPLPSWDECTKYLPDFEKRADLVFSKPEYLSQLQEKYKDIKRSDIVHECKETDTRPELGSK